MDRLDRGPRRSARGPAIVIAVLAALGLGGLATFRTGRPPTASVEPRLEGIGRGTEVEIRAVAGGRGLGSLRLELRQGDRRTRLLEKDYSSRSPWSFWGERTVEDVATVVVGSDTVADLEEGEAVLVVEARAPGTWLRSGPTTRATRTLPVLLAPPVLSVVSSHHYPTQGGCEAVVYRVGPTAVRDGVVVAGRRFPGYAVPGSTGLRFALFAVPFDLEGADSMRLEADDAVGNTASVGFVDKFFSRDFARDTITVSDSFLSQVVPEILANTPELGRGSDLVADYLKINRDLRQANAATLADLARESEPRFLWSGPFLALPNAKVMSDFAARRTYVHAGQVIDNQDHLGYDLASVRRAPVPAANSGRVALASYFGIYGNAVVIDHGFGLMSLYGHLSSLDVAEGEEVEKGTILGRTGQTGLAAGDHLHFTMLLHGVAVNPVEWWDGKWIEDRLARKLGGALAATGRESAANGRGGL